MSLDRMAEKLGVTPAKLAMVAVLGIVLAALVYRNFIRGGPSSSTAASDRPASGEAAAAPVEETARSAAPGERTVADETTPRKAWPTFPLAATIARDPFAVPKLFPQPRAAAAGKGTVAEATADVPLQGAAPDVERAAALAALQQQGVQLVLQNGQEYVAKIGDRQVRVGDRIDGFRVVDISFRGVILEGDASR